MPAVIEQTEHVDGWNLCSGMIVNNVSCNAKKAVTQTLKDRKISVREQLLRGKRKNISFGDCCSSQLWEEVSLCCSLQLQVSVKLVEDLAMSHS